MKNWKAWAAAFALVALVYFMGFHWARFLADFWPLDNSRVGPNLTASIVQWALIAIAVALLYPPARRALERYAQRHVDSIKAHISAEQDHLHTKMDHIIRNSKSIPNDVPGLPAHRKVKVP
jgi:hypothetical protein